MGLLDDFLKVVIPGYELLTKEAEKAAPGKTFSVQEALVTGDPKNVLVDMPPGAPPGVGDFLKGLDDLAVKDPVALKGGIRQILTAVAVGLALLSFIPATANFGAPTAARIFDRLIAPISSKVYDAPLSDALDNLFPTREVAPRMLVSGVEAGAFTEEILIEELVDAGTKDRSINNILRYGRVKRFEVATRDDIALLRSYESALQTATIATLQDEVRATINDLRDRRRELAREIRRIGLTPGS